MNTLLGGFRLFSVLSSTLLHLPPRAGIEPRTARLWHWQSVTLTTRLDLSHSRLDLIHVSTRSVSTSWLDFNRCYISSTTRLDMIHFVGAHGDRYTMSMLIYCKYGIYTSTSPSLRKQPEREGHKRVTECRIPVQQAIFIRTYNNFGSASLRCKFFGRYAVAIYWI
jgi:hypothetical protein